MVKRRLFTFFLALTMALDSPMAVLATESVVTVEETVLP